ncbi:MAG: hypothetical protein KC613_26780 [Myxococcales bacterium]|nr:hypothetical protein [Myxococcales bacterium]
MKRVLIAIWGWAWPVEVTGRLGGEPDALLTAVVELVHAGFLTEGRVVAALAPGIPNAVVQNAVRAAIERGALTVDDDGLLVATTMEAVAEPVQPRVGWVYWDPFAQELLPVLTVGERPGRGRQGQVIGWESPIGLPCPKSRTVRDSLTAMVGSPTFTLLTGDQSQVVGAEVVDQIVIPSNSRACRVRLFVPVHLLDSRAGRPNLVFRRATLELSSQAPMPRLWSEARDKLEQGENSGAVLAELDAAWRADQGDRLLPLLDPRFSSLDEAAEVVAERAQLAVPRAIRRGPYANELLMSLSRNAYMESVLLPSARSSFMQGEDTDAMATDYQVLAAWSGVLEGLTKAMLEEVRPYLAVQWGQCPSVDEAKALLAEWRLELGEHTTWLLSDLGPKRAKEVRKAIPWVSGGEERYIARGPGANLMVQLFVQATFVVAECRERHVARLRAALHEEPELFGMVNRLLLWRNAAVHLRQRDLRKLPAVDVFESLLLRIWRTLSRTFPG